MHIPKLIGRYYYISAIASSLDEKQLNQGNQSTV